MKRATVEQATTLDVNRLNSEDVFSSDGPMVFTWSRNGETCDRVRAEYSAGRDVLEISYMVGSAGEREPVELHIGIEWTECNFGGERPWFSCLECGDRVGTLHRHPRRRRFSCRDCQDLLYDSQTYTPPMVEAFERHDDACEQLAEEGFSRDGLEELHEAKQAVVGVMNDKNERLDEKFGDYRDYEAAEEFHWEEPDGFQEWADDFLEEFFTEAYGRSYGYHGRCTAIAKTTGIQCAQPARGDSGKCYYHGGARGSGVGEGQTTHAVEDARAIIEASDVDPEANPEEFLASDAVRTLRKLGRDKAHV